MAALSARAIAKKIGYSPGTLYNVFKNLDDLLYTIQVALVEEAVAELRAVPNQDNSSHVRALARCYMEFALNNRRLWNLLFQHSPPAGKLDAEELSRQLNHMAAIFRDALAPLMAQHPAAESEDYGNALWFGLHGASAMAVNEKLSATPPARIAAYAYICVDALLAQLERRAR